jgi:hypothetical protein
MLALRGGVGIEKYAMDRPSEQAAPLHHCAWLALLAIVVVPLTLLWDYGWEMTVGVDETWALPHVANYAAVLLAALAAGLVILGRAGAAEGAVAKRAIPLGMSIVLWGAVAFGTAVIFDRWWQAGYGAAAGIWHPPQLLKAVSFFALALGAWGHFAGRQGGAGAWAFALAGGAVLAMISLVTLAGNFANQQHGAPFYQVACGTYPIVLAAATVAGRGRYTATVTALCYTGILAAAVWLIPLLPGEPIAGPVYHHRKYLLPPPFPLLLIVPAVALDLLLRVFPARDRRGGRGVEAGLAFFFVFAAVQWPFASFLLSPAAGNWFFAGGGTEWSSFHRLGPRERVEFWTLPGEEFNMVNALIAAGFAVAACSVGLWLGGWMKRRSP